MQKNSNDKKGFTLLEVLLSVALIGLLAGLSVPVYRTLLQKNDLDIAVVTIAQTARRAQTLSQAVDGDMTWGVKIQSGSITLFKGTNFAGRDNTYDETFNVPSTINVSGTTEIVFAKLSGDAQTTGTITLTTDNDTGVLTINSKGMVTY